MTNHPIDAGVELTHDPSRVVIRLFLPGESTPGSASRTEAVTERVLAMDDDQVDEQARRVLSQFGSRDVGLEEVLRTHAEMVRGTDAPEISDAMTVVLGSVFTAEYAVEGAALCNPSVVIHPDQSDVGPNQLRVLLSLRSIGESHLSSVEFCEAIIGPGRSWAFSPRKTPLALPTISDGEWTSEHFLQALERNGQMNDLVRAVVQALPDRFASEDVEQAMRDLPEQLLRRSSSRDELETIRVVARSAYRAVFSKNTELSQRVLIPVADEERRGVEDVRFVRFTHDDGHCDYRGTFTAYNGHAITSRLMVTTDFRDFTIHRLTGPPARTKGMALFPRLVDGAILALSRGDGEGIFLTRSDNGLDWSEEEPIYSPSQLWDVVQSGNCGSPIETDRGWLVMTHGVGPMRRYSIGAILLDLNDPTRILATSTTPLLEPGGPLLRNGYVPNVVYSCGGLVHDDMLWLPYGVGDDRIRVASIPVTTLLDLLTSVRA
ncbi:MAG: glycoside hydrolase family 130 protein [Propionibacteriaceae bacterium]|jgi:predicted GH43/DUF377 family glycosyl hydrolase|nr:glycoside hydrolase family 130 protein [Propionibacteriaceae bacterium]